VSDTYLFGVTYVYSVAANHIERSVLWRTCFTNHRPVDVDTIKIFMCAILTVGRQRENNVYATYRYYRYVVIKNIIMRSQSNIWRYLGFEGISKIRNKLFQMRCLN